MSCSAITSGANRLTRSSVFSLIPRGTGNKPAGIKKITQLLDAGKGEDIIVLDLKKMTSFTDYFIIVTANSGTHLQALAKEITKFLKKEYRLLPAGSPGELESSWILIDYGDFIVHLFLKESREYYDLEELWFEAEEL